MTVRSADPLKVYRKRSENVLCQRSLYNSDSFNVGEHLKFTYFSSNGTDIAKFPFQSFLPLKLFYGPLLNASVR